MDKRSGAATGWEGLFAPHTHIHTHLPSISSRSLSACLSISICLPNSPPRICQPPSSLPSFSYLSPKQTRYPCGLGGKLKLCVWQEKAGAKQSGGRSKRWWLLLRGQQEGNRDILKLHPWNTTSMFLEFHHITDTHADSYSKTFKLTRDSCYNLSFYVTQDPEKSLCP